MRDPLVPRPSLLHRIIRWLLAETPSDNTPDAEGDEQADTIW